VPVPRPGGIESFRADAGPVAAGDGARRAIGVLGGTFNPPHRGHLALARHAQLELGLDTVLLLPAAVAPNKRSEPDDPGPQHRLAMCRLAAGQAPGVQACALEVERGGVSYTVDSLQAIHDEDPDAELTFIVGADSACTLAGWREPARLLSLASLAVAEREGLGREAVCEALLGLHPAPRIRFLTMAEVPVSSSQVRERVARSLPVQELVGRQVAGYIAEHGLYRTAPAAVAAIGGLG
jgi:nicotinate-nucleotide adenylyltransferase